MRRPDVLRPASAPGQPSVNQRMRITRYREQMVISHDVEIAIRVSRRQ